MTALSDRAPMVVVDNGSSDHSADAVAERFKVDMSAEHLAAREWLSRIFDLEQWDASLLSWSLMLPHRVVEVAIPLW